MRFRFNGESLVGILSKATGINVAGTGQDVAAEEGIDAMFNRADTLIAAAPNPSPLPRNFDGQNLDDKAQAAYLAGVLAKVADDPGAVEYIGNSPERARDWQFARLLSDMGIEDPNNVGVPDISDTIR